MLDTHAVAPSLTAADFTPAQVAPVVDALRVAVEGREHVMSDQFKPAFAEMRTETAGVTADLIAERLRIEKTAMIRLRAGISFALTEAMGDGHCDLPAATLTLPVKLLAVPEELIALALEQELEVRPPSGRNPPAPQRRHGPRLFPNFSCASTRQGNRPEHADAIR